MVLWRINMKVVVLNGYKVNYDGNIDYSVLSDEVVVYNDSKPEEILPRCEGADSIIGLPANPIVLAYI